MSFQARASSRASSRPPSPSAPVPKRRATLSARRELWLRGGVDSSDDEPRPSSTASGGEGVLPLTPQDSKLLHLSQTLLPSSPPTVSPASLLMTLV